MKKLVNYVEDIKGTPSETIHSMAYGTGASLNSAEVKGESIEINCPIKVDDEVLEIDLSRLDEEEKKQFHALLKKIQQPKIWKPELNETYYAIAYSNDKCISEITWCGYQVDNNRYYLNNCYPTIEAAEFAVEKLRVETEIKRYIEVYDTEKVNWKNRSNKYYLNYSHSAGKIERCGNMSRQIQGVLYFSGKLDWVTMINTIGQDRIKKYIFGVE